MNAEVPAQRRTITSAPHKGTAGIRSRRRLATITLSGAVALVIAACGSPQPVETSAASPLEVTSTAVPASPSATAPSPSAAVEPAGDPVPSGLVVVTGLQRADGCCGFAPEVHTVDPKSGEVSLHAMFQAADLRVNPEPSGWVNYNVVNAWGPTPLATSSMFDPNFTKVVVSFDPDLGTSIVGAARDVGWIASDGSVVNITESLYSPGDFGDVPKYAYPLFGTDGTFYATRVGRPPTLITATTSDSVVETPAAEGSCSGCFFMPLATGGTMLTDAGDYGGTAYSENITAGVGTRFATSWVDAERYLGVEDNRIWLSKALCRVGECFVPGWLSIRSEDRATPLTPEADGFRVWSPVASPDGTQVAFLGESEYGTSIYLVPISGGQPEQLTLASEVPLDDAAIAAWRP